MPIFRRSLILLAKQDATYGTDPIPTGAANAVRAKNVKISPMEGQDLPRDLDLPTMGNQGTIPADLHMKLEFDLELAPSGTAGTAPAFGPLLRACGMAQTIVAATSVTYNPVSTSHDSATFYFQLGGTLWKMKGARGSVKFTLNAQTIPVMSFSFTGLFEVAAEAARPTPAFTTWRKPIIVSDANTPVHTVNGVPLILKEFNFDLGVKVEPRFLIGSHSIEIVGREEMIEAKVEAVPLSAFDPFSLAVAQTEVPVVVTHGTVAGARCTITALLAQMQRTTALEESQGIVEWPLRLAPQIGATGNDQFTIAFT